MVCLARMEIGPRSIKAQACLTVRPTSRTDAKAGFNDPILSRDRYIAQRIKVTPGITG